MITPVQIRPNLIRVDMPLGAVWFSYLTPIAYSTADNLVVRVNDWSPTTGRHLNLVDTGDKFAKNRRVPGHLFEPMLEKAYADGRFGL